MTFEVCDNDLNQTVPSFALYFLFYIRLAVRIKFVSNLRMKAAEANSNQCVTSLGFTGRVLHPLLALNYHRIFQSLTTKCRLPFSAN